jgi:hypothetical protein
MHLKISIENLSWAAFHAERDMRQPIPAISAILLIFKHNANTAAMMRHCMCVIQAAVAKLNPGQTPVITVDQPPYALMKQIQWHWPSKFCEDKYVMMLGGLHTEMAAWRMLGHRLSGAGWIQYLVQAGIATTGVSESVLCAANVKRTRYAHNVTASALYCHLSRLYRKFCDDHPDELVPSFGQWWDSAEKSSVQFCY